MVVWTPAVVSSCIGYWSAGASPSFTVAFSACWQAQDTVLLLTFQHTFLLIFLIIKVTHAYYLIIWKQRKSVKKKAEKFTHRQPLLLTFHPFRQSFYGAFFFTVEIRPILSNMVASGHLWLFQVLSSHAGWWLPYGQCRTEYFHHHRKSYRTEQG